MPHVTRGHRAWSLIAVGVLLATWVAVAQQGRPVNDAVLRTAPTTGEEWLTYGLDLGEKRFSPLNQINTTNVSRLGLAWSYDIPGTFGNPPGGGNQEATPLMWNGTLYGITTWSVVFAVDARTGRQLWTWDPQVNRPAVQPKVCCGIVNRGVAIYEGKIIAPIIDGRLVALDAITGKPVWESRVAYPQEQYTLTMAPRIAKGKVIIGGSGSEYPVRGFIDGYSATTGQRAWRFYTVPGDPAKGFENDAMRKAAETWSGEWWKMGGGGTVWDSLAYDPEADLIYFGTGNGGPWPEPLRGSKGKDNLYVCSIIALRPDTGEMRWYYQVVPGDSWDYDSTQQLILADVTINRQQRRVIMQANKNGFYYMLDRITGAFISAQPFAAVNWSTGIDVETGRPVVRPEAYYGTTQPVTIIPGAIGAHNWSPMSFNPKTGLVYIPSSLGTSTTYTYNPDFEFREGARNTGTGRGGAPRGKRARRSGLTAGARADANRSAIDGPDPRGRARRHSARLGSDRTAGAVAQIGRRQHRQWNRHHRREPRFPDHHRWTLNGVRGRHWRSTARAPDRPAKRDGTTDDVFAGRPAVCDADGRTWRRCSCSGAGRRSAGSWRRPPQQPDGQPRSGGAR